MKRLYLSCFFVAISFLCPTVIYADAWGKILFQKGQFSLNRQMVESQQVRMLLKRMAILSYDNEIEQITILSSSSPDGSKWFNDQLSYNRAIALKEFLKTNIGFEEDVFKCVSLGENWKQLHSLVMDSDMKSKDEVLEILSGTYKSVEKSTNIDTKKMSLQRVSKGDAWRYMEQFLFPSLRNAAVIDVKLRKKTRVHFPDDCLPLRAESSNANLQQKLEMCDHSCQISQNEDAKGFEFNIRTNTLKDIMLIPNLGIEFNLGKGWSLLGEWMHAWWKNDGRHLWWRTYGAELEVRKYFKPSSRGTRLSGHHLGIYGQMFTYDFELGKTGVLADKWNFGTGVSYGYSLPLASRLNLDFTIGIGYIGGEYKIYIPKEGVYLWQETRGMRWFGPSKAEISLVWQIGKGNKNKKTNRK